MAPKNKSRENKSRDYKTRENKPRENKPRENKTRENKTRENKTRENKTRDFIYGVHAVESALQHSHETIATLWVQQGKSERRIRDILGMAKQYGISSETVTAKKLNETCGDASHQGIAVLLKAGKTKDVALEDILKKDSLLILLLDEVQDPHNIGACLRTADAAGVDAVVVSRNRSPGLTAAVRKVSSGAAETVPFIQVSNLVRAIQLMQESGVWVIGSSSHCDKTIYDTDASRRMALVMGSEGKGVRRLTAENCDELVSIPMTGTVESLNVSVATGICLFELRRQLMLKS